MAIEKIRKGLHQLIDKINDEVRLKAIKKWLEKDQIAPEDDFWDTLSDEEKNDIEQGLEDIKNGNVHTNEEVRKSIRKEFGF